MGGFGEVLRGELPLQLRGHELQEILRPFRLQLLHQLRRDAVIAAGPDLAVLSPAV